MQDSSYGPLNVTVSAYKTGLLTSGRFDRMINAGSFEDAVNVLAETPYRDDVDEIKESKDYDKMFMNQLQTTYEEMFRDSPSQKLIELASLRYSYHNLKLLFKEEFTGEDFSDLYILVGRYEIYDFRKAVRTQTSAVLPKHYIDSIRELRDYIDSYQNPEAIDIILDRRYLTHLRAIAEEFEEPEILDLVIKKIDFYNISTLVRAIKQGRNKNFLSTILSSSGSFIKDNLVVLANGGLDDVERFLRNTNYSFIVEESIDSETGQLSPVKVDYVTDNEYMKEINLANYQAFGPLPALGYMFAKETEITNLRLILAGKENNVEADAIKGRMRLSYGT